MQYNILYFDDKNDVVVVLTIVISCVWMIYNYMKEYFWYELHALTSNYYFNNTKSTFYFFLSSFIHETIYYILFFFLFLG